MYLLPQTMFCGHSLRNTFQNKQNCYQEYFAIHKISVPQGLLNWNVEQSISHLNQGVLMIGQQLASH